MYNKLYDDKENLILTYTSLWNIESYLELLTGGIKEKIPIDNNRIDYKCKNKQYYKVINDNGFTHN